MNEMLKKTGLWRGLAGLLLALTMLAIFTTAVLFQYASIINQTFNIQTSVWETVEYPEGEEPDTTYHKSTFGEINAENLTKLENAAYEQTENEAREGSVLLKNEKVGEEPALPLAADERKVTLFGHGRVRPALPHFRGLHASHHQQSRAGRRSPPRAHRRGVRDKRGALRRLRLGQRDLHAGLFLQRRRADRLLPARTKARTPGITTSRS